MSVPLEYFLNTLMLISSKPPQNKMFGSSTTEASYWFTFLKENTTVVVTRLCNFLQCFPVFYGQFGSSTAHSLPATPPLGWRSGLGPEHPLGPGPLAPPGEAVHTLPGFANSLLGQCEDARRVLRSGKTHWPTSVTCTCSSWTRIQTGTLNLGRSPWPNPPVCLAGRFSARPAAAHPAWCSCHTSRTGGRRWATLWKAPSSPCCSTCPPLVPSSSSPPPRITTHSCQRR